MSKDQPAYVIHREKLFVRVVINQVVDLQLAREILKDLQNLIAGSKKSIKILVILNGTGPPKPNALKIVADLLRNLKWDKIAIVSNKPLRLLTARKTIQLVDTGRDIKAFRSEEDARRWLEYDAKITQVKRLLRKPDK